MLVPSIQYVLNACELNTEKKHYVLVIIMINKGFPGGLVGKNLPANAGDTIDSGSIPGSGRSPGDRNGNPLQYSCLENPRDGGARQAPWGRKESDTTEQLSAAEQQINKIPGTS